MEPCWNFADILRTGGQDSCKNCIRTVLSVSKKDGREWKRAKILHTYYVNDPIAYFGGHIP